MTGLGRAVVVALGVMAGSAALAGTQRRPVEFSDLAGWQLDDQAAALRAFLVTCPGIESADWRQACAAAAQATDARAFFERYFQPTLIEDGNPALFTGYYEPEFAGSLTRSARFPVPVYALPSEVSGGGTWLSRAELEDSGVLAGRGLEIAWLKDPVDAFFLQVQGSGRINLGDGQVLRLGYAGSNGQDYRSVGKELVRQGILPAGQASAQKIRAWARAHPDEGARMLRFNPRVVFFRRLEDLSPDHGPIGAMNRPLVPMRSIAVDPDHVPLGAPVWVEKTGKNPVSSLFIAQDKGNAIRGAQRGDLFIGTGAAAGAIAGRMHDGGRMIVFLPRENPAATRIVEAVR